MKVTAKSDLKKHTIGPHTHTHTECRMVMCCSVYIVSFVLFCSVVRGAAWEHGGPAHSSCALLQLWR